MRAIILAGGFGTRLKHVVADVPKPMAPIAGIPFLAYLLDYLIDHGVDEVVLSVHHMHEHITRFFGESYKGVLVHYAIEDTPLGTGGAVRYALGLLDTSEPVLVLNGDSLVMLDHQAMFEQHCARDAVLSIALREVEDCSRYGAVITQGEHISCFSAEGSSGVGLINAGVYVLSRSVFDRYDLPEAFSIEHDFFAVHIENLKPYYYQADDYFIDIGVPEDYARAQTEIPTLLSRSAA